jgi:ubiquinone/menaquinone biosynthesis C-methylase UbiE
MSKFTDQDYLRSDQYRDDTNLNARLYLHQRFSTNPTDWMTWLFDQLDFNPGCRVLEIGCGAGTLWVKNLSRIPATWTVILSDLSAGMVSKSQESLGKVDFRFKFIVIDAQKLPFPAKYFDGVIANHVLFHMPYLEEALVEIHRVLRDGGRLHTSTIGKNHHGELHELLARYSGKNYSNKAENPSVFTLQNGAEQLSGFFSEVKLHRHEDSLQVTEVEPLIAYVQSMMTEDSATATDADREKEFAKYVQNEISLHQKIIINKEQGSFTAIRND